MKKILKMTVALIMMLLTFNSMWASAVIDGLNIEETTGTKSLKVSFEQLQPGEVTIKVKDEAGYVFFTEKVKGNVSYAKKYDLSALPAGTYLFTLADPIKEVIQPVLITETEVKVNPDDRKSVFQPYIRNEGRRLDVSLLLGSTEDVTLSILDSFDRIVYEEVLENSLNIQKRFQLKRLPRGEYLVKLVTPYKVFHKWISI